MQPLGARGSRLPAAVELMRGFAPRPPRGVQIRASVSGGRGGIAGVSQLPVGPEEPGGKRDARGMAEGPPPSTQSPPPSRGAWNEAPSNTCTLTYTCAKSHTDAHTCIEVHTQIQMQAHRHMYTLTHTKPHRPAHPDTHAHTDTHTRKTTHRPACTHTFTHNCFSGHGGSIVTFSC